MLLKQTLEKSGLVFLGFKANIIILLSYISVLVCHIRDE